MTNAKNAKKNVVENDLAYFNDLKIYQDNNCFKFSLDSIILPYFIDIYKNTHNILDLCTGNAPIPIILTKRTNAKIYGIEIQKRIYDLAVKSVKKNKLDKQIKIINENINDTYNRFESDKFDIISCNPPYFKNYINSVKNITISKAISRHEINVSLDDIFKISRKLLKNNGKLYLVHRTERLIDIICLMRKYNIEPKKIRFVYSKNNMHSNLILISGTKNGKMGFEVMKPLIVHNDDGSYTKEILNMFS